ncbi:MAG TPA: hypothetical protein VGD76_07540 [Ramlibacter sp.]
MDSFIGGRDMPGGLAPARHAGTPRVPTYASLLTRGMTSRGPAIPADAAGHLLFEERLLALRLPAEDDLLLPPLALARSLCALLFWVLALPPLLAAWARLDFPEEADLEEDEEEELRDAIACSLVG